MKIEYEVDAQGNIIIQDEPPFDGEIYLLHIQGRGWCEGWWCPLEITNTYDGPSREGFIWVLLDDLFQEELDSATHWLPLPDLK